MARSGRAMATWFSDAQGGTGDAVILEAGMMDTKTVNQQISAFADGELDCVQHAHMLDVLRTPAARAAWNTYHEIGDVVRSSDAAIAFSPDFEARMAARLATEPSHLGAPGSAITAAPAWRRFGVPGGAMAATVLLAVALGPRFPAMLPGSMSATMATTATMAATGDAGAAGHVGPVVLRDSQIDEYLLAHQRFSPSLYSTAQYARSSTFAADFTK